MRSSSIASAPRVLLATLVTIVFYACSSEAQQREQPPAGELAPKASSQQIADYPSAPMEDRHGTLWFSTAFKGLVRYDGKDFVSFTEKDGLGGQIVRDVIEDPLGGLWITTNGGLTRYDGLSFSTITDYRDTKVTHGFSPQGNHRDVWAVLRDSKGRLWITTLDGVFRLEGRTLVPFPMPVTGDEGDYEFTSKMVYTIFEDRDGDLWFGTDGVGVVRYDGKNMVVYTTEKNGLCSDRICTIVQDKRGHYWFGSSDGGVSRYDGKTFTTHLRNPKKSGAMGWGRFMAIHEARDGGLWFGACGEVRGAYRYDGKDFRFYSEKDGLGDGHIASISEDSKGQLWFGTTAGVYYYDGKSFVNVKKQTDE